MAIYRFEAKVISRGGGRSSLQASAYRSGKFANGGKSAVSAAAYRAGAQMVDERTGTRVDYTKKRGVLGAEILLPDGTSAIFADRQHLWNAVEAIEKRRDAQLARDFILTLPHEMTQEQRVALTRAFVKSQFCDKGLIADVAWHAPDKRGDDRNYHAHVMIPMRRVEGGAFARKKDRPPGNEHPAKAWANELARLRQAWAETANQHLRDCGLGHIQIDHRSLQEQGIDREPEPKIGSLATEIERSGRGTLAGNDNRAVRARNVERARMKADQAEAAAEEARIIDLVERRLRSGAMTMKVPTEEELRLQQEREADGLRELKQQEDRLREFRLLKDREADDAKRMKAELTNADERRQKEGDIADAKARYGIALGESYDIRDPYGSLARAAMNEYSAFLKGQQQLRSLIAEEQDADKRRLLELRREIEAHDYMAITSERLVGISATIAGREDSPQAKLDRARAEAYAERAGELRRERSALIEIKEREVRDREAQSEQSRSDKATARAGDSSKRADGRKQSDTDRAEKSESDAQVRRRGEEARRRDASNPAKEDQAASNRRQREDKADATRAGVTGRKEGDAELSEAQQAKLERLEATKAHYAQLNAARSKDRGGGRGGR